MNFKQMLYCKVLGWNGRYENPGFVKVPETFYQLETGEEKIQHLMSVLVDYDDAYRYAHKDEAECVLNAFKSINNCLLAAYEALAENEKES